MAVGDVYELLVDYSVLGEHCVNAFKFRETVEETDDLPARNLALSFQTAVIADWAALLSNQAQFNCIYCRRISPTPGVAFTVLLSDPGEEVSEAIPTTSAVLMTWYSAVASKRGRGRNYFAGLPEIAQAGGKLEADVLAAWEDLAATIMATMPVAGGGTGNWALCVWSEVLSAANDVIASVVRTNLATMRTRRQRPGTS